MLRGVQSPLADSNPVADFCRGLFKLRGGIFLQTLKLVRGGMEDRDEFIKKSAAAPVKYDTNYGIYYY